MAVLKDLIVHGQSRFINGAQFNAIKANNLAAEQGYFNKLVAVDANISSLNVDDLTAQNATVVGLLDVKGELHSNSWTNSNIATIDGSFYITPTVSCNSGTFAYNGTNITVTAASGNSFGVDSLYTYTTAGTVTTYTSWPQYSRVLLTGEVKLSGSNEWQPLGTIRGQIVNSSTSFIEINNLFDSQGTTPIATLVALGSTSISNATFRKVKVSLYERASSSSSFFPMGIYMTALGTKGKTFIDIYGGGDAKGSIITNGIDSGAMAKPVLRIGNLSGLPLIGTVAPQGWGIYTNNGFFEGTIVAKQGKIANWDIDADRIYSNSIGVDGSAMMSTGYFATINIGQIFNSGIEADWVFTAGNKFGVTSEGKLYATDTMISGSLSVGKEKNGDIVFEEVCTIPDLIPITTAITGLSQQISQLQTSLATLQTQLNTTNTIVNTYLGTNKYIQMVSNVLTIQNTSAAATPKIIMSNDKISLQHNNVESFYINQSMVYILNATLLNKFKMGNFAWQIIDNQLMLVVDK